VNLIDRYRGSLVGLATGDALGTTLEFKALGTFKPISDMIGKGPFNLKAGEWTDDTSMALCLAQSLIDKQAFEPDDQMNNYLRWCNEGYMSSNGECFDIGRTISAALNKFESTGNPIAGETNPRSAGNGSIMRLAPIPLTYRLKSSSEALSKAAIMSQTTHGAEEPVDACRFYTALILSALNGCSKIEILNFDFIADKFDLMTEGLTCKILEVAEGSYKNLNPPQIIGTGYVVKALESALWAFYNSDSFEEGALLAVNLGNDADTTGAIYGQLAGCYYGINAIPQHWVSILAKSSLIFSMADQLLDLSERL
jgi:ADP-ribosyl-[dinitrogen reductase] hydrolase